MSRKLWIAGLMSMALTAGALASVAGAEDMALPAGVKGDMLMWIKDAEDKLVQLAEATPEAKYAWRPGKGVRTQAEVFMHVVTANYGIPAAMGVAPPQGFTGMEYEKSLTKKADIQKALKESFAHMENALVAASDADMEKEIELFGMKMTERRAFMLLVAHSHEHLGQSIAYARSNGIVPPWTAKQQAAMKEATEKKKAEGK
ncbi:MAG TPA: DinB family protein [Candidatus Eisenbacteria bacterium]|nr:DinB family protein [Candidatus Eisenbacteria bacterium]